MARPRLADARHEAAHAIVAWLLGYRCTLTLVSAGQNRAACIVRKPCRRRDDLLIFLAALLESCRDDALFWTSIEGSTDLVDAVDGSSTLAPDDPGRWFAESCQLVRFILGWRRTRRAIDALARELVRHRELGEDDVDHIIAEAFAAPLQRPATRTTTSTPPTDADPSPVAAE